MLREKSIGVTSGTQARPHSHDRVAKSRLAVAHLVCNGFSGLKTPVARQSKERPTGHLRSRFANQRGQIITRRGQIVMSWESDCQNRGVAVDNLTVRNSVRLSHGPIAGSFAA